MITSAIRRVPLQSLDPAEERHADGRRGPAPEGRQPLGVGLQLFAQLRPLRGELAQGLGPQDEEQVPFLHLAAEWRGHALHHRIPRSLDRVRAGGRAQDAHREARLGPESRQRSDHGEGGLRARRRGAGVEVGIGARTEHAGFQLQHAREVALLAANMAAEMGLDVQGTKRAAILHDVGKGMTHEHEGTHVELGYRLCKKHDETPLVLNAIKAHHDEEPHFFAETFLAIDLPAQQRVDAEPVAGEKQAASRLADGVERTTVGVNALDLDS